MKNLTNAWKRWKKIARVIGNFEALIIFTIFYYLILWTVGIFIAAFSDPLSIKKKLKSNFVPWNYPEENLSQAQKPY